MVRLVKIFAILGLCLWPALTQAVSCPGVRFVNGGVGSLTCADLPASGTYPSGGPPQIGGFGAANTPEAETVGGDCTFARTGANVYAITCTKTNGTAFGSLATLGAGTSLQSSGGNLNLNMPGGTLGANNFATALSATGTLTGAQPASTNLSDASTGTWTPLIFGSGTGGSATYSIQVGAYYRIGALVVLQFNVEWTAFSGATGLLLIGGIPFSAANITNLDSQGGVAISGITFDAGYTYATTYLIAGGTSMYLVENGSGKTSQPVPTSGVGASGYIRGTLVYRQS